MAKMITNKARPVALFESNIGRYTLRSDGSILRQLRIDGKLEHATIVAHVKEGKDEHKAFERYNVRMGGKGVTRL